MRRRGRRGLSRGAEKSRWERAAFWVTFAVGITALLGFAWPVLKTVMGWTEHAIGRDRGRLVLTRVVVGNGVDSYGSTGFYGEQAVTSTPRVDLTVRNAGKETAMLEKVVVAIEDSARFAQCIPPQGGGPVPFSRYPIELPLAPTPRGVVEGYSMLDQVPPGEVDRPLLRFGVRAYDETESYLYALRVRLLADSGQRIDLGSFVLALPGAIDRAGFDFPEDAHWLSYTSRVFANERLVITWCFRRNLATLSRLVAHPGRRSQDVQALAHIQLAANWPRYADPRPPRTAAERLLHEQREGPQLAAFAASRSGDARFAARIRRRAAALLVKKAEGELHGAWQANFAASDARDALSLVPSAATRTLLLHAEAAVRDEEEKREAAEKPTG